MSDFSEIITPYISSEKMNELLDQATSNPEFTARGSNSQYFLSGDEDYFRDQKNPSSFSAGFSLYGLSSPAEISAYTRDLTK